MKRVEWFKWMLNVVVNNLKAFYTIKAPDSPKKLYQNHIHEIIYLMTQDNRYQRYTRRGPSWSSRNIFQSKKIAKTSEFKTKNLIVQFRGRRAVALAIQTKVKALWKSSCHWWIATTQIKTKLNINSLCLEAQPRLFDECNPQFLIQDHYCKRNHTDHNFGL